MKGLYMGIDSRAIASALLFLFVAGIAVGVGGSALVSCVAKHVHVNVSVTP